jgi:hypothetical protein
MVLVMSVALDINELVVNECSPCSTDPSPTTHGPPRCTDERGAGGELVTNRSSSGRRPRACARLHASHRYAPQDLVDAIELKLETIVHMLPHSVALCGRRGQLNCAAQLRCVGHGYREDDPLLQTHSAPNPWPNSEHAVAAPRAVLESKKTSEESLARVGPTRSGARWSALQPPERRSNQPWVCKAVFW